MRLIDMAKGLESLIETLGEHSDMEVAGLTSDSRAVQPGYLFAALPGVNVDGRDYISQAQQNGAVCVLGPMGTQSDLPVIEDANPRLQFSKMAANFYGAQPDNIAAITGTNGKTSVATFLRQIWECLGYRAANVGTIGVFGTGFDEPGTLTTPDPVTLHATIKRLADAGVDHLAMEASSHGLEQFRLDGLRIKAAGFTNITRDHLDYHGTMDAYLVAKLRLFSEVVEDGGSVVVNADSPHAKDVIKAAQKRNLKVITYGEHGDDIRLKKCIPQGHSQVLTMNVFSTSYTVLLPLSGAFQMENALCALGLALALGADEGKAVKALERLHGVIGRMQCVGHVNGADVYVDYAHTPDALENVLKALRPHTQNKLHIMFGCGGDRDVGKRPEMGRAATAFADVVIITDDNPRNEDAATIRQQILTAAPGAKEIGDRHQAIQHSVKSLGVGDILVLTGKGHEQGQTINGEVLAFDDVMEVKTAIRELGT